MKRLADRITALAAAMIYIAGLGVGSLTPNGATAWSWCGWAHPAWGAFVLCGAAVAVTISRAVVGECEGCAKLTADLASTREALLAADDKPKALR